MASTSTGIPSGVRWYPSTKNLRLTKSLALCSLLLTFPFESHTRCSRQRRCETTAARPDRLFVHFCQVFRHSCSCLHRVKEALHHVVRGNASTCWVVQTTGPFFVSVVCWPVAAVWSVILVLFALVQGCQLHQRTNINGIMLVVSPQLFLQVPR